MLFDRDQDTLDLSQQLGRGRVLPSALEMSSHRYEEKMSCRPTSMVRAPVEMMEHNAPRHCSGYILSANVAVARSAPLTRTVTECSPG